MCGGLEFGGGLGEDKNYEFPQNPLCHIQEKSNKNYQKNGVVMMN